MRSLATSEVLEVASILLKTPWMCPASYVRDSRRLAETRPMSQRPPNQPYYASATRSHYAWSHEVKDLVA